MTSEQIKKYLDTFIKMSKVFAKFTPNSTDDKVVEMMEQVVGEPWFMDILEIVVKLTGLDKDEAAKVVAAIKDNVPVA